MYKFPDPVHYIVLDRKYYCKNISNALKKLICKDLALFYWCKGICWKSSFTANTFLPVFI